MHSEILREGTVHRAALLCVVALLMGGARAQQHPSHGEARRGADMEEWVERYETDRGGLGRFYDLAWSEVRMERLRKLEEEWLDRLEEREFDGLDQQGRIDFILLRNEARSGLDQLRLEKSRLAEMEELLPFRRAIQDLELARWRMEPIDPQASAGVITPLPEQVKQMRRRLEGKEDEQKEESDGDGEEQGKETETPKPLKVSPVVARRAAGAVRELRETLERWFNFYNGYEPEFSWWVGAPYKEARAALEGYEKFLREEVAGLKGEDDDPLVGDPIGREALMAELQREMIVYTPEELIRIGEREFEWCEARMKEAAAEMGFAENWKDALAEVKSRYVPPGRQDEFVAEQAREAIRFVKERGLVTVPELCEETWRLTMISPEGMKNIPFAAYGGQNMMVAYPKEEMKHEDKVMTMRGNNRHFTRIVTAHELIPGHHLQAFMAARHRTHRRIFSTPFFVEGWAVYWETVLWDKGYPRSPEDRIGMLFWRMHRCARIIVSLRFHLGEMEPREMVDFLVERVGHERFGAASEVRRFIGGDYSPLYQCGYMIGALQLRALREEALGSGRLSEKEFHDRLLEQGAIPIELVRAALMDVPLRRDQEPEWRFAEPAPASE